MLVSNWFHSTLGTDLVIRLPDDLNQTIEIAFQRAHSIPGFLAENELRFLGALAACTPAQGAIVEIGSFKGKSTVMLASVAARYGLGQVVAIDPHAGLSYLGPVPPGYEDPTFNEFLASLKSGGSNKMLKSAVPSPAMLLPDGIAPSASFGSMATTPTAAVNRTSTFSLPIFRKAL